jgi:hypothetical protein
LRLHLFSKDLVVYESKSYALLPIYRLVTADCNPSSTQSIQLLPFTLFALVLGFLLVFLQLDLLAAAITTKVVVVHASSPSRHCLVGGEAHHRSLVVPLTAIGLNKTGPSDS